SPAEKNPLDPTMSCTASRSAASTRCRQTISGVAAGSIGWGSRASLDAEAPSGWSASGRVGNWVRRSARHCFDDDCRERCAVVEVDVGHGVMAVVIAAPVDVVVLHEQDNRYAGIGEDLPVGVVERAAWV